ncbi:MFS transporter [Brachybacterium sp. AOP25-B2-12]|uniref:MFS transporter n=1 Tax=Brachybacterium sp. AOP25-B2-12 TaxID=3457710 RepID=UPI00403427AF
MIFLFLAVLGALIMIATLAIYRETLPAQRRTTGGMRQSFRDFRKLLSDTLFVGAVLICGLTHAVLFAYLSGATYILQDGYGLSPQGYFLAFGANSAGYMIFGWIAGRTADRWSERGTLAIGVGMTGAGSLGLLYTGLAGAPLVVVLVSLFVLASGVAFAAPPSASLALAGYPELAGTASSVLGFLRFGLGDLAAPLVGLAGATAVLPLGIVTVVCVALSLSALVVLVGRGGLGRVLTDGAPAKEDQAVAAGL